MSMIWSGFLSLLNCPNHDVMFAVARNLSDIFNIFSRDPSEGLLHGSICSTPTVRMNSNN